MKTKRFVKLMQLLLVAALTVCLLCAVGISSSATAENSLEVGDSNLEYSKYTHLIVTLTGTVQDGYTKGIAVWAPDVTGELTADNASFTNFTPGYDLNNVEYYATQGIPASEMGKEYSIAPAVKDAEGNVTLAGEIVKRSITGYVMERLGDENLQSYQVDLYRKLIAYGTASEAVLDGGAQTTVVVTKGGYVGEQNFPLAIVEGEAALIRASVQNAEGQYFSHWADSKGNLLTGERVATVAVNKGINTFTAVYCDKADSAYGYFADFQSFELGEYNFTVGDLTDDQKTAGTASLTLPMFTNPSTGANLGIKKKVNFDTTALEGLADTDVIPTTESDSLNFKSTLDGVKYLNFNRILTTSSEAYHTLISNASDANIKYTYERFEIDVNIEEDSTNQSTVLNFEFQTTSGFAKYQFVIGKHVNDADEAFLRIHYYPQDALKIIDIPASDGKRIFTIGTDIDANGVVNLYIDGEKLELEAPIAAYSGTLAAGEWHPVFAQMYINGGATFNYNIYSVGLVDTDKTK